MRLSSAVLFGRRRAGMLAHVTSLPGDGEHGTLGGPAYAFVDFLHRSGFSIWQMLPIHPLNETRSPYQPTSVFAGNTALLPETTRRQPIFDGVDQNGDYLGFCETQSYWLDDYALYHAFKWYFRGLAWYDWPAPLRDREPQALRAARRDLARLIDAERHAQHLFFAAWHRLKSDANARGVYFLGDIPMFAAHDSADVWAHRPYFWVDDAGALEEIAGVPPDAFSDQGQHWGNPQYRWDRVEDDGFRWWVERLRVQTQLFDALRLDHFRGFEASWYIQAGAGGAAEGRWLPGPGRRLFDALANALGALPLIAEDLGLITPQVQALRDALALPGMHVLQFAFSGDADNPHLPHKHHPRGVVYTGTHDNDTTLGWWQTADAATRGRVAAYLDYPSEPMPWPLIHCALGSVCALAMVPLQDCLGLGSDARMNMPGTGGANWQWRCDPLALTDSLAQKLAQLIALYGRAA